MHSTLSQAHGLPEGLAKSKPQVIRPQIANESVLSGRLPRDVHAVSVQSVLRVTCKYSLARNAVTQIQ